ncbi:MAG: DUF4136 domain-containing protein [Parasphingorhabdus sp.]|nr:DUF4136 domain-containing protein [Parasphingorhabdus sp.]
MRKFKNILLITAVTALSACTVMTPPVEVTRFHEAGAGSELARGAIAVEAQDSMIAQTLEQRSYAAAVERELQRVGYQTAGDPAQSEFVALVNVTSERLVAGQRRSPVSVGVGGSTGSYGSGIGLGIGLNLSGKPKDIIATEMFVRINRRTDGLAVWEGRATVEAKDGTPASQPGLAAAKLAQALFSDFPGTSGRTITVP